MKELIKVYLWTENLFLKNLLLWSLSSLIAEATENVIIIPSKLEATIMIKGRNYT